jgi:four helix bundle protein
MAYKTFEENLSWQKSQDLIINLFTVFKNCEENWVKDDLLTKALDSANFIAKGHENNDPEEYVKCLNLAKDKLTQCRSMLSIAEKLKLCNANQTELLQVKINDASRLIFGLSKKIKERV